MASQLPHIVKFAYSNVRVQKKECTIIAKCQFCKGNIVVIEKLGTTSNFVRYLQIKHFQKCVWLP